MLTYGDGLSNVNLKELLGFHRKKAKSATITAVQSYARFGALDMDNNHTVLSFKEKPKGQSLWINGGFFVLEPEIFKYIKDDFTVWEREPMERLTARKKFNAYKHNGFWSCMDTLRDKLELERLWRTGEAPWKAWK